jgi:hypothetical protein
MCFNCHYVALQNNDAVFSKFMSLHEGDKYVEEGRRALQARAEKTKENIVDKPFKMSSPMKSSACPGDYIGTLGGKIAHQPVSHVYGEQASPSLLPHCAAIMCIPVQDAGFTT